MYPLKSLTVLISSQIHHRTATILNRRRSRIITASIVIQYFSSSTCCLVKLTILNSALFNLSPTLLELEMNVRKEI